MKALKLNSQFEGARKLAECLIGSPTYRPNSHAPEFDTLVGIQENRFVVSYFLDGLDWVAREEVIVPLETLKFCPFVGLRNGVKFWLCVIDLNCTLDELVSQISALKFDSTELPKGAELIDVDAIDRPKIPKGSTLRIDENYSVNQE